jgi:hypothetical protein
MHRSMVLQSLLLYQWFLLTLSLKSTLSHRRFSKHLICKMESLFFQFICYF